MEPWNSFILRVRLTPRAGRQDQIDGWDGDLLPRPRRRAAGRGEGERRLAPPARQQALDVPPSRLRLVRGRNLAGEGQSLVEGVPDEDVRARLGGG